MTEAKTPQEVANDLMRKTLQLIADIPLKAHSQTLAKACLRVIEKTEDKNAMA